jgi:hypothetical protein
VNFVVKGFELLLPYPRHNASAHLAVLRHIALNLPKQEKTAKGSIHAKQLQAAWGDDCLLKVLASGV